MNSNYMLLGIGGLADSGATSCPPGSTLTASPLADGSMDWTCVEECDEVCQAANAPVSDFSCPSGYTIRSLADGTKNCVADDTSPAASHGCPAGQVFIPGFASFGGACSPITVPAVLTPWYKKPLIVVGLLAAVGGIGAFYWHTQRSPRGM